MNKSYFSGFWGLLVALLLLALGGCQAEERSESPREPAPTVSDAPHHLSEAEARAVALDFIQGGADAISTLRSTADDELELAFAEPTSRLRASSDESADAQSALPAYYVFNIGSRGFVIVSAWDVTFPILAYSDQGAFFSGEVAASGKSPEVQNVMSFLSAYASSIDSLRQVTPVTKELRSAYTRSLSEGVAGTSLRASDAIAPLLGDIKWNQSPYYNAYCPSGTPVGCVATATCQIMRYWKYPEYGTGSHRSTADGQYATFNKRYNWDNMPAGTLRGYNDDVAQLCYDIAVGLNMQFSPYGSGTWQSYVPGLLVNNFYYKDTARDIYRSNYSASDWASIVYNELANGRPVQYAGAGRTGAGHSFVCDGYYNGYFHINWGWGGMSDGYFLLHALDPSSLGTGGGSGGFNYGQDIVIGIEPARRPDPTPDPDPQPGNGSVRYLSQSQLQSMVTFDRSRSRVTFGRGVSGPMVLFIKATGCSHCEHTRPSVDLLAREYSGKVPFYGFDVVTYGQWAESWDYIQRALGVETVPQMVFIDKDGRYTLVNGVIQTTGAEAGARVFRPYVERILSGGVDPTPDPDPTPSGDYCKSSGRYARSTYIAQVSLANMNNTTQSNEGGYNYFSTKRIDLAPGQTYRLTLTPGSIAGSYPEYWSVWIDTNGDRQFTSDEQVLSLTTTQANSSVTREITIPSSARKGDTRMRVSMKWGATPEACEVFDHGEVEDYPVRISGGISPDPDPTPDPDPEPEEDPYPVSYGKDSRYAWISSVHIGDMDNSGTGGDGYASYIGSHHILGYTGRALSYQLTPSFGTTQTYWCYWRIWIDYNKDGHFSSSELVTSKYGYRMVSGWFTLPYRMDPGLYRVRVSMKMNEGYPAPDEVFNYGEVEDYRLRIR